MSKFIKVTGKLSGKSYLQNISSVESISDNEIEMKSGVVFDIKESVAQIEAQLLRDEFAKAALNGLLSNSEGVVQKSPMSGTGYVNGDNETVSAWAYGLADAMLKERLK